MCGIIGYLGKNEASPILLESLRRLEYRGYDSAGITTIHNGKLFVKKAAGRLVNLADLLVKEPIRGKIGIGHTRWATHGKATTINAHPQSSNNVSVVHNGIIENYKEIKKHLIEEGYVFRSETDTEVIPLLCQKFLDQGFSYTDSVHQTVDLLKGQYAICFLFENNDDLIFLARSGSPLVIGHSGSTMYVASDALALAGLTKEITYLEDGDTAAVTREGTTIFDKSHKKVHRSKTFVSINAIDLQKGGFKHYMLKEIHEQPKALTKSIQTVTSENWLDEASVGKLPFDEIEGVNLLGCGTAEYACMIASYWFENLAKLPGRTEIASEFKYRDPIIKPNDLSIFVSQSGETADTLSALRYVIKNNGHNLSILNNLASTMAKEGAYSLPIHADLEISVASTKAFTCQLVVLAGLALEFGKIRKTLSLEEYEQYREALLKLPGYINIILDLSEDIRKIAQFLTECPNALFIGRGLMFPTALEGALKLKEISYIHAEGMAAGELKHGPISLIERTFPTIVLAPSDYLFDKTKSNMEEIQSRNGPIILLSDAEGIDDVGEDVDFSLTLPKVNPLFAPIIYTIPLQLLAYHSGVIKGLDVDNPRHLAKSVTVE